jgi:hypothetical protein
MQNSKFKIQNSKNVVNCLRLCVSALMLFVLAFSAFAQKEKPPTGGQPKPYSFSENRNLRVIERNESHARALRVRCPKVAMQAIVRAGSLNEKAEQRWISDAVATMLKEGTATRTAEQIARERRNGGGSIFTSAGQRQNRHRRRSPFRIRHTVF